MLLLSYFNLLSLTIISEAHSDFAMASQIFHSIVSICIHIHLLKDSHKDPGHSEYDLNFLIFISELKHSESEKFVFARQ